VQNITWKGTVDDLTESRVRGEDRGSAACRDLGVGEHPEQTGTATRVGGIECEKKRKNKGLAQGRWGETPPKGAVEKGDFRRRRGKKQGKKRGKQ